VDTSESHQRRSHGGGQQRKTRSVGQRGPYVESKSRAVPPFRTEAVEITLDTSASEVEDTCRQGLVFNLEVNAENGRNLYRVQKVRFPLVHRVTRFVPPTMSMVLYEILHGQGRRIPDSCLPLYMMAIDTDVRANHAQIEFYQGQYEKLEDLTHKKFEHSHKDVKPKPAAAGANARTRTSAAATSADDHDHERDHLLPDKDHHRKKTMLKRLGCMCHWSEFVRVNVSDTNANYYYPNTTGVYEFSGRTHDGRPYYTHNATSELTYFLYFHQPEGTWYIDDNLGDSSPKLSIVGTYDRCPGDMSIIRVAPPAWQYVKSLVWYNIQHAFVSCGVL